MNFFLCLMINMMFIFSIAGFSVLIELKIEPYTVHLWFFQSYLHSHGLYHCFFQSTVSRYFYIYVFVSF